MNQRLFRVILVAGILISGGLFLHWLLSSSDTSTVQSLQTVPADSSLSSSGPDFSVYVTIKRVNGLGLVLIAMSLTVVIGFPLFLFWRWIGRPETTKDVAPRPDSISDHKN